MHPKVGIIGAGNMSKAIVAGMINSNKFDPNFIKVSNRSFHKLEKVRESYRVRISTDNRKVAEFADVIILAVKPKHITGIIEEIRDIIEEKNTLVISIAAGISISYLCNHFDSPVKIIRTMPNTPAIVQEAMTAISYNHNVNEDDLNIVQEIFHSFGRTEIIPEELMDVVTAVSGSSPAIVYMFIEALADGAVLKGLPRDVAYRMVSQAILGAAKLVRDSEIHPGKLKDNVTSSGGTAIEALYTLEKKGFRGIVMESIEKCTEKSDIISKRYDK